MIMRFLGLFGFFAAVTGISDPIRAQTGSVEKDTALTLEDKMTTATRTPRKSGELSRAVNVVDGRDLAARIPRNSAEVLREEAGIEVQKTEHGGGNAIVRGMGSSHVLLLVDGIRLNNSTYRSGHHPYLTTVDNNMLDRMEVVRGPGSSLFGSDALGATINLITRNPVIGEEELDAHGRAYTRYSSADEEKIVRAEGSLAGPRFGMTMGASLKDAGDLRRGGSDDQPALEISPVIQENTGYRGQDFDAKLAYQPGLQHRITLAWQSTARPEIPRYDKYVNYSTRARDKFYRWLYTDQDRDLAYLIHEAVDEGDVKGAAEAGRYVRSFASYHRQEEGRLMQLTRNSVTNLEWGEARTYGAGTQVSQRLGRHVLTGGMEAYVDGVSSTAADLDTAGKVRPRLLSLYPDGATYGSYGLFVQDEMRFGRLNLTAGARYSLVAMDFAIPRDTNLALAFGSVDKRFQAVTGSLGAAFSVIPGVSLVGNLGQGFRAPNLSDVARTGESKTATSGNTFEIPNPDLEPSEMVSGDAGVKVDRARFKGGLYFYRSEIWDILGTAPATHNGSGSFVQGAQTYSLVSKQNLGEAAIQGLELDVNVRTWGNLWAYGNAAYTHGENTTLDEPVSGIPPLFGLAGLRWTARDYTLDGFMRFALRQDRLSADDKADARITPGGTPGWYSVTLRGQWRLHHRMHLNGGVENLTDYNYREHGSGINSPGRNFIASAEFSL